MCIRDRSAPAAAAPAAAAAAERGANFEVARDSLEMAPRCSPGAGASHLSIEGPATPRSRAAGARRQLCRQTGRAKNRRRSGTGGTPGRIRTDHIVRHRGGEPPRAHRRAGRRGTRPRRQRGESTSRPAVTWQLDGGILPCASFGGQGGGSWHSASVGSLSL